MDDSPAPVPAHPLDAEAMKRAEAEIEAGEGVPHADVARWLKSWCTNNELPPPKAHNLPNLRLK